MARIDDITIGLSLDSKDFTVSVSRSGSLLRRFNRDLVQSGQHVNHFEKRMTTAAGSLRRFVLTIASVQYLLQDFHQVFLALPMAIIKSSAEIERMTKLMEGLSTEVDRQKDALKSRDFLFNMAQNAPFDIKALQDSFVKFKSAGIDPMNGSMQTLIDSVARFGGDSNLLHRASIAIQQMAGKGVISMEELRQQLGEAVPSAMSSMARGMGISMAQLAKEIQTGTVAAKGALDRMFAIMRLDNDGAAAEMMKTWSGLFSKLQTKWELFKFEIGGGGRDGTAFARAKEELEGLLELFDLKAARQLSSDLSYLVKQMVDGFGALIRFVKEYYEEIKLAGAAMLTYFASSKIVSMGAASYAALTASARTHYAAVTAAEKVKRHEERVTYLQKKNNLKVLMAEKRLQMAQEQASAKAMAQAHQQAAMQSAAAWKAAEVGRSNGRFMSGADRTRLYDLSNQLNQEADATKANAATHHQRTLALRAELQQMQANRAGLHAQIMATGQLTAAMRLQQATMTAGRAVWAAMGGWIGAVTAALAFGIYKWYEYATAAEKAAERASNAAQGISTKKALEQDLATIDEYQTQLASLRQTLSDGGYWVTNAQSGMSTFVKISREATQAQIDTLTKTLEGAQETVAQHRDNIARDESERLARVTELELDRQISDMKSALFAKAREAKVQLETAHNEMALSLRGDPKALEQLQKELLTKQTALDQESSSTIWSALVEKYSEQIKKLDARLVEAKEKGENVDHLVQVIMAAEEKRKQALANLEQGKLIGTAGERMTTPGVETSPLQRMLAREESRLAQLRQHFSNLRDGIDGIDGLRSEVAARIEELFEGGMLKRNKDGTIADDAGVRQDMGKITETITQRVAMEKALPIMQDLVRRKAELDSQLLELDNANGAKSGKSITAVEKYIASLQTAANSPAFEALKQQVGDVEKHFAELRAASSEIDMRRYTDGLRESNRELHAELVLTERERFENAHKLRVEDLRREEAYQLEKARMNGASAEYIIELQNQTAEAIALSQRQLDLDLRSPLERLADSWKDITERMKEASADWANRTSDSIIEMVKTGKFQFGDLVTSILEDIARLQVQQMMAGMIQNVGGMIASAWGGGLNYVDVPARSGAERSYMQSQARGFATGGVMTGYGEVPLRKYARGGIATKPQLALFGEGSMPEAYVPLPDGRTIPVTMKGGQGQGGGPVSVQVNVINQGGEQLEAQQTNQRFDGAAYIVDVVVKAASRPGPLRDTLRGSK